MGSISVALGPQMVPVKRWSKQCACEGWYAGRGAVHRHAMVVGIPND